MKKSRLTLYIFLGFALGILAGWLFPKFGIALKPVADMFLRMIKMLLAPLIFSTLVVGIAGHGGDLKSLGKTSLRTFVYFEIVTTIALVIGLCTANFFNVGSGIALHTSAESMQEVSKLAAAQTQMTPADTLTHMIPVSIIDAMAKGDMLQIVIFAVFFAIAVAIVGDKGKPVLNALSSLSTIMFKFTGIVMSFAPIGVFAAIANTVGQNGIKVLGAYTNLIFALYLALFIFVVFVLVIVCKIIKIPFFSMIKVLRDPALLAFSTASSEAALPKGMEVMEKFGVPKSIVSFVMPAGYTFNMDGSTLYLSLATIFVSKISGVHLSLVQQLMIMLTLMLTSKGIAGVPRVTLVILTGTLSSFNLPVAGVAVLLGIDHILDMGRTTINLIGNCVAAAVIACWEKRFDYNKMRNFIRKEESDNVNKPVTYDQLIKEIARKKQIPEHNSGMTNPKPDISPADMIEKI